MLKKANRVAGILAMATAFACSSSSSTSTGLDPSKQLDNLAVADLGALCDWTAAAEGGYGTTIPCDASSTSLQVDADQATCVANEMQHFSQPTCSQTVGDWMGCVKWRLANWCAADPPKATGVCAAIDAACFGDMGAGQDAGGS